MYHSEVLSSASFCFISNLGLYFEKTVSTNIFDDLPDLTPAPSNAHDKLTHYLAADVEIVKDGLAWWNKRSDTFPCLSHMACNYLSIPSKCLTCFLVLMLIFLELPLLMLNGCSAEADSSCPMSIAISLSNQHAPSCVLEPGAS
jgi:hypothetical protein